MTRLGLILRGVRYHWRAHAGVLLGTAVASAVLIGALMVGDSVRGSLRQMALARLGATRLALHSGDRLFRAALADDVSRQLDAPAVPVLTLNGTASTGDGSARAFKVQVLGVDRRFATLADGPAAQALGDLADSADGLLINQRLADQLRVEPGARVILRVAKPSALSRDAPLSPEEDATLALPLTVKTVLRDDGLGRFSLRANQVPPFNAFVPLDLLQARAGVAGRANLLLLPGADKPEAFVADAGAALAKAWTLEDAQAQLRYLPKTGEVELRSSRIFLDEPLVRAARAAAPEGAGPRPVLTYLVNELEGLLAPRPFARDKPEQPTPYSMVAALDGPLIPEGMGDDEVLISSWLAEDQHIRAGDELAMTYYVVGPMRTLEEESRTFKVRAVVPVEGYAADRELMPDFPGLAETKDCSEWDPGFPLDLTRIRDKDETYWDDYKGTPKAFVTLKAGQAMWQNRFGSLTAMRYPAAKEALPDLAAKVHAQLEPAAVGLFFVDARAQALQAGAQAMDFGGLFIGFSFFLILAALLLTALLFVFGIEKRASEIGTLRAVGWPPEKVRSLFWGEGLFLAGIGALIGLGGALVYARAMLWGLSTVWRDAVRTSWLEFHTSVLTCVIGYAAGVLMAFLAMWWVLRRQLKRPARILLAGGGEEFDAESLARPPRSRGLWIALPCALGAVALAAAMGARRDPAAAGAFFGAGALLLIAGLSLASWVLTRMAARAQEPNISIAGLGLRNDARRRGRSLATIGLLASGTFLVMAVGANQLDAGLNARDRGAGTGGFALWAEAALPVTVDLNSAAGRQAFALNEQAMQGASVVPMRVRDGDDASCLNLNRAQRPRLLGVNPESLVSREAFTFAGIVAPDESANPWLLLRKDLGADVVPAIGDQNSIMWALGQSVGGELAYEDAQGRPFRIRIVGAVSNSILQGSLLIDEARFVERFPGEAGYRIFLVDAPSEKEEAVAAALGKSLADVGLEVTTAVKRLAAFNAVQNTYLATFAALGGLGLVLGSVGLGLVVLRNVLERRGELALMRAVGFRPAQLRSMVLTEHGALLLFGLACGVVAALVAALPALRAPGVSLPVGTMTAVIAGALLNGAWWTWLATHWALKGSLMDALRSE